MHQNFVIKPHDKRIRQFARTDADRLVRRGLNRPQSMQTWCRIRPAWCRRRRHLSRPEGRERHTEDFRRESNAARTSIESTGNNQTCTGPLAAHAGVGVTSVCKNFWAGDNRNALTPGNSRSQLHFAGRLWHAGQRERTYGPRWACRRRHSGARSSPWSALGEAAPSPPGLGPVSRAIASGCPYGHRRWVLPRPEDNGTRTRTKVGEAAHRDRSAAGTPRV